MPASLPAPIVATLAALGQQIADWIATHADAPLADHEAGVLTAIRTHLPQVLSGVVTAATTTLAPGRPPRPRCPGCHHRLAVHSWRPRTLHTRCGPLTLQRPWYRCPTCHHGVSPADTTLGLAPHQRLSAGLDADLTRLGAATSFREAATVLTALTGLTVAPETVRQHTEAAGAAREARTQTASTCVATTQESPTRVPAPGWLIIETDGVMVRYRDGWHEVKLAVVAGQVQGRLIAPSYVGARASPEQFGPRLVAEAARRGGVGHRRLGGTAGRAGTGAVAAGGDPSRWRGVDLESGRGPLWGGGGDRRLLPRLRTCVDGRARGLWPGDRGGPHLGGVVHRGVGAGGRARRAGGTGRADAHDRRRPGGGTTGTGVLRHPCRADGVSDLSCPRAADRLRSDRVRSQASGPTAAQAPGLPVVQRPAGEQTRRCTGGTYHLLVDRTIIEVWQAIDQTTCCGDPPLSAPALPAGCVYSTGKFRTKAGAAEPPCLGVWAERSGCVTSGSHRK